jgi:preprotein translocase subunit YajC
MHLLILLAQADKGKGGAPPAGGLELPLFLLAMFILFYLIVLRPANRRQQREREALLTNLKKNDKVLTTSGIYATVVSVSDKEDEVVLKVDDNCRVKMIKGSIARNFTREEEAKAQKAAKDSAKEEPAKSSEAIRKDLPR